MRLICQKVRQGGGTKKEQNQSQRIVVWKIVTVEQKLNNEEKL